MCTRTCIRIAVLTIFIPSSTVIATHTLNTSWDLQPPALTVQCVHILHIRIYSPTSSFKEGVTSLYLLNHPPHNKTAAFHPPQYLSMIFISLPPSPTTHQITDIHPPQYLSVISIAPPPLLPHHPSTHTHTLGHGRI